MVELKEALKNNVVEVLFTKLDGNTRVMQATLQAEYLPKKESVNCRVFNPDIISCWSIEDKGWRSFRKDSVISYVIKEG